MFQIYDRTLKTVEDFRGGVYSSLRYLRYSRRSVAQNASGQVPLPFTILTS